MNRGGASGAVTVTSEVRRLLLSHGFDRVGFARAGRAPHADRFEAWLRRGYAADMDYLGRSAARRVDPRQVLDGVQCVIAVALHHERPDGPGTDRTPASRRAVVASYARGTDYHRVMERRLREACGTLSGRFQEQRFRYYVDTGPVLERSWAEKAGIGWIGKNACAIDPERGSFFFIGVVLTTLELDPDPPALDHCGACRICIDSCPTGAIVEPYSIDSTRCISYQTIENRASIPDEIQPLMGNLVFGCDICQEVCPFNHSPDDHEIDDALLARPENRSPAVEDLAEIADEAAFRARFPRSAIRRTKLRGLLRNAIIAIANSGEKKFLGLLERIATHDIAADPVVAAALARARARLEEATKKP